MKQHIKFSYLIAISVFLLVFIVETMIVGYSNIINNRIFNERIENYLVTIAKLNAGHAGLFLKESREKMPILADADFPEEALAKIDTVLSEEELEGLVEELEELLEITEDAFEELFILNIRGEVVASSNLDSMGGVFDLEVLIPNEGEARISEVYYSDILRKNVISISSNIIDDNRNVVAGILVGNMDLGKLAEIVSAEGLSETGESYVVNSDGLLITPSKFLRGENKGVLTQQVGTKNIEQCFKHIQAGVTYHPINVDYLDYRGESVIGSHRQIPGSEWCLVVKIDSDEVFEASRNIFLKNQVVASLILLFSMTTLGFIGGRFLDKGLISLR